VKKRFQSSFRVLTFLFLVIPSFIIGQKSEPALDPVSISKNYYNSIVKILLYDSIAAKSSPELAYLGRGSGFFVSRDGYIFTNRHVIDYCRGYCRYTTYNKDEKKEEFNTDTYTPSILKTPGLIKVNYTGRTAAIVQVYTNSNGSTYRLYYAKVVSMDTSNFDGAILKIVSDLKGNPVNETFHPVTFGNSDSTQQGQDLCLYGFPAQLNGSFDLMVKDPSTLMFGKNSGFDYNINTACGFIKTDAIINSGNSGGPVFGPGNTVIGIATAAFEKTNIGLIGGINNMNDLLNLVPELRSQVLSLGFSVPSKKTAQSTAVFFKRTPLPTEQAMRAFNYIHAGNKISNSFSLSVGLFSELPNIATQTIAPYTGTITAGNKVVTAVTTNGGSSNKIPNSGYGIMLSGGSPNILKHREKDLLTGFMRMNLEESQQSWNAPTPYSTPYYSATALDMNASAIKSTVFTMTLGFNYSRVLNNGIILGLYYGIGITTADIGEIAIGTATSNGQTAAIEYESLNVTLPQTLGINLKYRNFFADLSYTRYTESIDYTLPYYYEASTPLFWTEYLVGGTITRQILYLSLGYTFYFYPMKH